VECEIVDSAGAFLALAAPWRELAGRARVRPFQEHGWHAAWLATLGAAEGWQPHAAVLRDGGGGRLLGVLPLVRRRQRGGLRVLKWSGTGVIDYCDAILDPAVPA